LRIGPQWYPTYRRAPFVHNPVNVVDQ